MLDLVQRYLHETLGIAVGVRPWSLASRLPYFLQDAFDLRALTILDQTILLALKRRGKMPLATVRQRLTKLRSMADQPVLYVTDALASYERRWLIQQKVPFLVPGNQLYLPDLGIDLREYFRRKTQMPQYALSPATQAMLLRALLNKSTQIAWLPAAMAAELGYTAMTLSRITRELKAAEIATVEKKGTARWLHLDRPPAETWELAKPLLRTPVKESVWVSASPETRTLERKLPLAGHSALARYSQIAEPTRSVYAIDIRDWRVAVQQDLELLPEPYGDSIEVQVWRYRPAAWRDGTTVDPLSLTLSLQSDSDERIQTALEELERQFPW